ncbi:MAG: ASCH domain-containing protein [Dysgonomonas sp.]
MKNSITNKVPICPHCHRNLLCQLLDNFITDAYCCKCSYIPINQIQFITDEYKAITIKQPYPYLICTGIKDIENRTWKTKYRGRVYIHASANYDNRHRNMAQLFTRHQWKALEGTGMHIMIATNSFDRSSIIGYVDIIDCIQNSTSIWALPDHYNWILSNPVLFDKPIENVKGSLSFWDCSNHLKSVVL